MARRPVRKALGRDLTQSRRIVPLIVLLAAASSCGPSPPVPLFFADHLERAELVVEGTASLGPMDPVDATLRAETRRALPIPMASGVTFALRLPEEPMLRFAIAASTLERASLLVPVDFVVHVEDGEGAERAFAERIQRSRPNQWFPREVDLSRWAGEEVRLTFEAARAVEPRPIAEEHLLPLWGNPVLVDRTKTPSRPSLFLISIDCLRADHLGIYGYGRPTSPNIDAFARDAVVFERAVAASSYTLPAHASMLTGLPPSLHGAMVRRALSPSVAYAPALLREAGYRVNAVVSAAFLSQTYGFERGFHTYRLTGGRAKNVVDQALTVVDESAGQEQFLFLHLYDAHAPYAPPRDFIDRFVDPGTDVSELLSRLSERLVGDDSAEVEQVIALYDAEIAYVDQEIGRFLDELDRRGLYDTSIIIITSDHGEAFLEHGAWEHGRATALDEPGLYEEIVSIPLIVKWPGEASGISVPAVASQVDVSATLLEAAGLEDSSPWAVGLRRYVGEIVDARERKTISEVVTFDPDRGAALQLALSDGATKYIASFGAPEVSELYEIGPTREELYDLRRDPRERNDLLRSAGVDPGPFRAALRSYFAVVRESVPGDGAPVELDDGLTEELRALGYLEP